MTLVLADVGGTNLRFAHVRPGGNEPTGLKSMPHAELASFDAGCRAYCADNAITRISRMVVAVAGPVSGQSASITNRGWSFDSVAMARQYGGAPVYLINDLSALGLALDHLAPADLAPVLETDPPTDTTQRLVIGAGTGFNVSPVLQLGGTLTCLRAEAGLTSLPERVLIGLQDRLGARAARIACVEDLFSGSGLERLHVMVSGGAKKPAKSLVAAAHNGDAAARETVTVFARMLGEMVQDLRLAYMPSGGIFLAGSVLRGVLGTEARAAFLEAFKVSPSPKSDLAQTPIHLILKDEAGLMGCLVHARDQDARSDQ